VWHFVLTRGVLKWGVVMFGATVLPRVFRNPARVSRSFVFWQVLLWVLGGALFGYVMWLMAKKKTKPSAR